MPVTSIFFPFPTMLSSLPKANFKFLVTFILSSANAFSLDQSEILSFGKELILHTIPSFSNHAEKTLENIVGKGENAGNQHFLPFPHSFSYYHRPILSFEIYKICLLQIAFNLDQSKIVWFGKKLSLYQTCQN